MPIIARFFSLLLLIAVLAGCGAPGTQTPASTSAPAPSASAPGATPAATNTITAGATEEAGSRSVEHVFGTSEVPANPQRIVAADLGTFVPTFGVLSALGVRPVAVTANQVPGYLSQYAEGVTMLPGQANYEAIAAAQPDLIITPGVNYNEENYKTLAQIAPTAAPNWYWQTLDQITGYWREVATLVNKQAEGDQLIADLNTRIADIRAKLEPRMQGKTVSVLQVQQVGLQGVYLQTGRAESALLHAVGVQRPANQTYDPNNAEWYVELSTELLPQADAWAIFVEVYADDPNDIATVRQQLESNPLWGQLEAVKNKRIFFVQTDEWSGTDPFVLNLILDTIEQNLTTALDAE